MTIINLFEFYGDGKIIIKACSSQDQCQGQGLQAHALVQAHIDQHLASRTTLLAMTHFVTMRSCDLTSLCGS